MRMLGLSQPKFVPPLNSNMAIETGSHLIGELTMLTIGITLIVLEFARQARNDKKKHDLHRAEREKLKSEMKILKERINLQIIEMKNLQTKLSKLVVKPEFDEEHKKCC